MSRGVLYLDRGEKMEENHKTFLIGVDNICKHFGFGRVFFYECLRLGLSCKKISNRYVLPIKKMEEFIEKQMK